LLDLDVLSRIELERRTAERKPIVLAGDPERLGQTARSCG
jgi:hypothetical protein